MPVCKCWRWLIFRNQSAFVRYACWRDRSICIVLLYCVKSYWRSTTFTGCLHSIGGQTSFQILLNCDQYLEAGFMYCNQKMHWGYVLHDESHWLSLAEWIFISAGRNALSLGSWGHCQTFLSEVERGWSSSVWRHDGSQTILKSTALWMAKIDIM